MRQEVPGRDGQLHDRGRVVGRRPGHEGPKASRGRRSLSEHFDTWFTQQLSNTNFWQLTISLTSYQTQQKLKCVVILERTAF